MAPRGAGAAPSGSRVMVGLDSEWYDLTTWVNQHPGGPSFLERYSGHDATEAFYSLHSDDAVSRLKKMRPAEAKESVPATKKEDVAFRKLREDLRKDGWFNRSVAMELFYVTLIIIYCVSGHMLAWSNPLLAIILLGLGMQQAGWLGHDMTHARHSWYCEKVLPYVSGWINGFDRDWWSEKHNTHHVLTNHVTFDPDINNQPFLFLWPPPKALDTHLRKYQHIYFLPLYAFLYVSWRIQSFQYAWAKKNYHRLLLSIMPSYIWLATLPAVVSMGSVLFGGLLVALVVTVTHESEELIKDREESYCVMQFRTTRNVICPDFFTNYLFGGMQYQLEHHLFPTMPRYHYPAVSKIVKKFAKENGVDYKASKIVDIYRMHYQTLKKNALAAAAE